MEQTRKNGRTIRERNIWIHYRNLKEYIARKWEGEYQKKKQEKRKEKKKETGGENPL